MEATCTFKLPEHYDVTNANDMGRCICNQEGLENGTQCVMCHDYFSKLIPKWEREAICEIHHKEKNNDVWGIGICLS